MLDGMFSFVLLDTRDNSFIAARDAIGITSLYIGWGLDGNLNNSIPFMIAPVFSSTTIAGLGNESLTSSEGGNVNYR